MPKEEIAILADSVLQQALDREGLYTIASDLKPISTIFHLYLDLAKDSLMIDGQAEVVANAHRDLLKLKRIQEAIQTLKNDSVGFYVGPFALAQGQTRVVQIMVYKKRVVAETVDRYQSFFGQFGLTPLSDPQVIIHQIENASFLDRYRGYGYLFGYPAHAVDFFVEAGRTQREGGDFVERDFFQIPVHVAESGHFVYAVPKGYEAQSQDLKIRAAAAAVLERYNEKRPLFEKNGRLYTLELLKAW
jgi:hypothetical protein